MHIICIIALFKVSVRKFCLFVAISVLKPGIAAVYGIILLAWVASRHGSSTDESNVLKSMCGSHSVTAPVWMFTVLRNHRF